MQQMTDLMKDGLRDKSTHHSNYKSQGTIIRQFARVICQTIDLDMFRS